LELGRDFAFVGNQYHLEIGGQDYFLDSAFLSSTPSMLCRNRPETLKSSGLRIRSKMNFYLSPWMILLRHVDDSAASPDSLQGKEQELW